MRLVRAIVWDGQRPFTYFLTTHCILVTEAVSAYLPGLRTLFLVPLCSIFSGVNMPAQLGLGCDSPS